MRPMIPNDTKYNLTIVKYGETFYRRHTALIPTETTDVQTP